VRGGRSERKKNAAIPLTNRWQGGLIAVVGALGATLIVTVAACKEGATALGPALINGKEPNLSAPPQLSSSLSPTSLLSPFAFPPLHYYFSALLPPFPSSPLPLSLLPPSPSPLPPLAFSPFRLLPTLHCFPYLPSNPASLNPPLPSPLLPFDDHKAKQLGPAAHADSSAGFPARNFAPHRSTAFDARNEARRESRPHNHSSKLPRDRGSM